MTEESKQFQEHKNTYVKGFMAREMCNFATQYVLFTALRNHTPEAEYQQVPGTHSIYADPFMETLLKQFLPFVESSTGLNLIPTYSYYRLYKPGDVLKRHKDRPACEVTTSITLGWHYVHKEAFWRWPLSLGDSDGTEGSEGIHFQQEVGDAVIYRGLEVEHWREKFDAGEGSYHAQVFLHYVDADGPYAEEHKYDGRPGLGFLPPHKPPKEQHS